MSGRPDSFLVGAELLFIKPGDPVYILEAPDVSCRCWAFWAFILSITISWEWPKLCLRSLDSEVTNCPLSELREDLQKVRF